MSVNIIDDISDNNFDENKIFIRINMNRTIIVGKSNSGKSKLLYDLLFKNLLKDNFKNDNYKIPDLLNIILYSLSLKDSDHLYKMIIIYNLYLEGYSIDNIEKNANNIYNLINNFELIKAVDSNDFNNNFNNNTNNFINLSLKIIIEKLIHELNNLHIKKDPSLKDKFINTKFYFCKDKNTLDQRFLNKLINDELLSLKSNEEYLLILDDVSSDDFATLQTNIISVYEQGRHHNCGVVFIDQYYKSSKMKPAIRENAEVIIARAINEDLIKFIKSNSNYKKMSNEDISKTISDYYALIFITGGSTGIYRYKSSPLLNEVYKLRQ